MASSAPDVVLVIVWVLLVIFTGLAVVGTLALLSLRAVRQVTAKRHERDSAAIRARIVEALVEEGDDAEAADRDLLALRGSDWDHAEEAMLAMLPKVRGDAQNRLVAVLRARGTDRRAVAQTQSRRAYVRCDGAFALGVLRSADGVDCLLGLLADGSPLVRRVAVRSLGQIGDARATQPLLALADREPGLTRDLVFALSEIGPAVAPVLRSAVGSSLARPRADDRIGPLAASVLGMIQDIGASPVLAEAVERGPVALKLAAVQALGHLDSPAGLAPLHGALRSRFDLLRVAAATSLGRLGSELAIAPLLESVRSADAATARASADALLALGPQGWAALESSGAPYAVEALALDRLRSG